MRHALTLAIVLALSVPAWAHPGYTNAKGCHTGRNWVRHCHETVNLMPDDALEAALIRAHEKNPALYQTMEEALVNAETKKVSGRMPGGYRKTKKAQAEGRQS